MTSWLRILSNKIFGGFRREIEEKAIKKDFGKEKIKEQPEDKGRHSAENENEGFQQRRTCHFFVVFPKTMNQDSYREEGIEQEKNPQDERSHQLRLFNKPNGLPNNLHRKMVKIPREELQVQQKKEDGFIKNDDIITQDARECMNGKTENLPPQGLLNMNSLQLPKIHQGLERETMTLKSPCDDNLFPNIENFCDEKLGSLTDIFKHDNECVFMENLKCDSPGFRSQGEESFQTETKPSPSFTYHSTWDEKESDIKQHYKTKFSNHTNFIHKRKRNADICNEDVKPKMKEEAKREMLYKKMDYKGHTSLFVKRQKIDPYMSNVEETTNHKFRNLNLLRQKHG